VEIGKHLPPGAGQWALVAGAGVLATVLWQARGDVPRPGRETSVRIMLQSFDRDTLSCALGRTVEENRCEYSGPDQPWPAGEAPDEMHRLAPYVATDRRVLLLAGLFTQPALERRFAQDRSDPHRRFEATCRVRLIEPLKQVNVRFGRPGGWGREKNVWVAVPLECTVD
jgi:hypothetical protein